MKKSTLTIHKSASPNKSRISARKTVVKKEPPVLPVESVSPKSSKSKILPFGLVIILIGVILGIGIVKRSLDRMVQMKNKVIPDAVAKITGGTVTLKEISNIKDVSGVYQFDLSLDSGGKVSKYTSYITKDGKILFTSGTKLDELDKTTATGGTNTQKKLTCADVTKTDQPTLTTFIVSNCPFGLQMQRIMKKAITEQPELSKYFVVKYIGSIDNGKISSMHGDDEAQENLRQICIREEQQTLYWPYVSCYMTKQGQSESCLSSVGVNTSQVNACMTDAKRGLAFAQKDFDLANKYQIGSSPTLLMNDTQTVSEFDFGGRVPQALKEIVCCGSNVKPAFCSKDLSKDTVAASFSESDAQQSGSGSATNCGN
jgi:hypothetical protein